MRDGGGEDRTPNLPYDYSLDESDLDAAILRKPDGSEVAAFGKLTDPREMERAAREGFRGRGLPGGENGRRSERW